jgi:hypothetical protein
MLQLPEMELKKTRFYQEVFGEGHQEGRQEGWQEGRKEGRQEGVADTLLRLMTAKFGPPPRPRASAWPAPTPRPCCAGPNASSAPRTSTSCLAICIEAGGGVWSELGLPPFRAAVAALLSQDWLPGVVLPLVGWRAAAPDVQPPLKVLSISFRPCGNLMPG